MHYVQTHAVHPGVVDTDLFKNSSTTAVPGLKKFIFKVKIYVVLYSTDTN